MTNTHDCCRLKERDFLLEAHRYSGIIIFHRHRGVLSVTVDELQTVVALALPSQSVIQYEL